MTYVIGCIFELLSLGLSLNDSLAPGPGDGPFPSCGVWADGCAFRLRPDGGLTLADGGLREEHDLAMVPDLPLTASRWSRLGSNMCWGLI